MIQQKYCKSFLYSFDYHIDNVLILLLKSICEQIWTEMMVMLFSQLTHLPSKYWIRIFLVEGQTRIFWMKREGSCHCCYGTLRKPCSFSRYEASTRFSLTVLYVHAVVAHIYVSTLQFNTLFLPYLYVSLSMHVNVSLYSLFSLRIIQFASLLVYKYKGLLPR